MAQSNSLIMVCCESNRDEEGKPLHEMSRCDDAEGDFLAYVCKDCESKNSRKA